MSSDPDLDAAYALNSPEATRQLYADWAATYDADFSDANGFQTPRMVAEVFLAAGGKGPVLDVGAGTGLLGAALNKAGIGLVDGIDLSPDMLEVAATKNCYRSLATADVTAPLNLQTHYSGIVSSGTFTLGHVGIEGLGPVLDVAAPGARVVIGMNQKHFEAAGFGPALNAFGVRDLSTTEHKIYAHHQDAAHKDDIGLILSFSRP